MIGNKIRGWVADLLAQCKSLPGRITQIIALSIAVGLLLVGATSFFTAKSSIYDQMDGELADAAIDASIYLQFDLDGMAGINSTALDAANLSMVLVRSDGTLRGNSGASVPVKTGAAELAIARTQMGISARTVLGVDGQKYRQVAVPMTTSNDKLAVVIARPLSQANAVIGDMSFNIFWVSALVLVGGIVVGYFASRSLMVPLNTMAKAVSRVTETDELVPIGIHSDDEIGMLSRNFDTMIHSLSSSRERQKRLIADAGHELRTPLTSMRTNIELLVADQKSGMLPPGAKDEILADVSAQLAEFTSLVGDLVQLSRDDAVNVSRKVLDFAEVVTDAVTRAKRRGPHITFDVKLEPLFIVGEQDTLGRAVTNLLDNAVKFSPREGHIFVRLHDETLTIEDEGPGIAEEDLDNIFDRFYRSDKARNTPGTGLGLSIVKHTIEAHGGSVWASNSNSTGGAKFTVVLPAADEEELAELGQ